MRKSVQKTGTTSYNFGGRLLLLSKNMIWARIFAAFLIPILAAFLVLLEAGLVRRELIVTGQFTGPESPMGMFSIPVPKGGRLLSGRSDAMGGVNRSGLRLWVNGAEYTKPHALHDNIRSGALGTFSHWGESVYFMLPPGTENGPGTSVKLSYPIQLTSPWLTLILLSLLGAIWFAVEIPWLTRERVGRFATLACKTLLLVSWIFTSVLVVYVATIIYGFLSGYALPTATVFVLSSTASRLHHALLFLPWILLTISATGTVLSWVTTQLASDYWQTGEKKLIYFWNRAAIPAIFLVLLFDMSGGGWSGRYLPTDINYMSNAGLTPYSDAAGYYSSAFEIGYWGHWNWVASQRPIATALRNLTVLLGGEMYPGTLVAQALLVTFGIAFALRRVLAWRGFWVGLAFFALVYGLIRPFLLTTLTENLGFLWAVISVGFFAESFRRESLPMGLLGFATLTGALMTRMGSMFSIPALILWLPLAFAQRWRPRSMIFVGAIGIVLSAVAVNGLLGWLYAAPGSGTGGNFSSTFCGLAHGSHWAACYPLLSAQRASAQSIHDWNHLLYAEGIRAIRADPHVLISALWSNATAFVYDVPAMLMEQYNRIAHLDPTYLIAGLLLLIPGWMYLFTKPGRSLLVSFALAIIISSILSAAVVWTSDGTRTMIVAYVFLAFFASIGFSAPGSFIPMEIGALSWRRSAFALIATLCLLAAIPPIQGATVRWASKFPPASPGGPNISIIPGKPVLTGFAVVPDGWRRENDIPSLNLSQYTEMYLAIYTPELGPAALNYLPQAPFAVVFALPQDSEKSLAYFIGPIELLTNRTPNHWRLEFDRDKSPVDGVPFLLVTKATPVD